MNNFILYIPVIHQGYIKFLSRYKNSKTNIFLVDPSLLNDVESNWKEIRGLDQKNVQKILENFFPNFKISILNNKNIKKLNNIKKITTTDDTLLKEFADKYLHNLKIEYKKVFLRWDENKVTAIKPIFSDSKSMKKFDRDMIALAKTASDASSDWWRHVGAVIVKDGKIISKSFNHHTPSEYTPYIEGDARDFIKAGLMPTLTTAIHAEQSAIATSAKNGQNINGADIYVNVFPCPVCANLIIESGIKRVFYNNGSAYLNVEKTLKAKGVKIILVK